MSRDRWRREARVNPQPVQAPPPEVAPGPPPVAIPPLPRCPAPTKPTREEWSAQGHVPELYDEAMAEVDRRYARIVEFENKWYEPGPMAEKWAFAPGATREDIDAAEREIRQDIGETRPPGSASPIHLVVESKMRERMERGG